MLYIKKPNYLMEKQSSKRKDCQIKIPCCVLFLHVSLSRISAKTENTKLEMKVYIVFPNNLPDHRTFCM